MRIVFLSPVGEFGGAERSLLAWMIAAKEAFPNASLALVVPNEGPLSRRAGEAGVTVEALPLPSALAGLGDSALARAGTVWSRFVRGAELGWRLACSVPALLSYVGRLRALLKTLSPDLIHSNGIKTHLLLRLARWPFDRRGEPAATVWHIHDFVASRPLVSRVLRWASSRGVTAAIAVSNAVAEDARGILSPMPIRVVYNVVDVSRFRPGGGRGELLDELSGLEPMPSGGGVRVVLVATYAKWKGHEVVLRAAAHIAKESPQVAIRFYIVGGPIYRTSGSQYSEPELRALAEELGISRLVGFVGFQDEPADVYRAADIVVHASTRPEPFGLTIIEAMACGKSVVVARAGGAAELFVDGHDAAGVTPESFVELAAAIDRLARNALERSRLGANARQAALKRFSPDRLPAEVYAIYTATLRPSLDRM